VKVDWSCDEVEAAVADYFAMLADELRGIRYNKTDHRKRLRPRLAGRSGGSVEFKRQNISAALLSIGFPYISGYKPRWNYQRPLLDEVVARLLGSNTELVALAEHDADKLVPMPTVDDVLTTLTTPPRPIPRSQVQEPKISLGVPRPPVNYLEREARNRQLGLAGEEFVIRFERARLIRAHREALASKIQHVSTLHGDAAGFDVLSFEESGTERLIEVKTTKYGADTPFFLSRNELSVSELRSSQYKLYRVFDFRERPQLFTLSGRLSKTCLLKPSTYIATLA
jgi:hypothetical protein